MRTAIDEFSTIGVRAGSSGDAPVHTVRPVRRHRRADLRRPRGPQRPHVVAGYDRVPVATPARGPHPLQRVEQARIGLATLAATALLTAAAVCGLLGVAQLRDAGGPASTQTVQVQPGESLSDLAQRVAPKGAVRDTVARIVELNGLRGTEVAAGRTLVVPASR
ncbi:LysM peptidoglycan-binding domain-containing protein [Nocardia sp. BSTN01]|uniref:LysM peptidoglycan-binding domain-containing protein n=1 Tax=Nocardia sp. BSTN01 TaxID=2783665 RepID=UPI00188E2DC7|nr:LysM peptidoglycan-binding domain-containing protein [Nocardia sp. BSTN01]MBF4998558.1 LysM peptidoglycan-binding domain-containing protein [Nocardia sp. BSTN01]